MSERIHRRIRRGAWLAAAPLLLLSAACGRESAEAAPGDEVAEATVDRAWNPQAVTQVGALPVATVRSAIQQQVAGQRPAALDEAQWKQVERLYGRFGQGPLWFGADGLLEQRAQALLKALINARADALRLEAYPINELARALAAVKESGTPTAEQVAQADVMLTSSYAALGEDLLRGQVDPREVTEEWHIDPQRERVDSALVRALRQEPLERSMASMRPQDEDYAALQKQLEAYRRLAARGGFTQVPAGRALKPGQTDSPQRLTALRRRLQEEGLFSDSAASAQPQQQSGGAKGQGTERAAGTYDARLAGAVAAFQARHGIDTDSVLGAGTVASMNTPAGFRLAQIAANLERHRWLPRSLGSRYILVNVPAFRLEAYEEGKKALEMKVIVGEEFEGRITPVFSDSMEYVVFRPYWMVTDDIAEKELFPKIQDDPGLLQRSNYEIFQEGGKQRIRQKPGPKNSLGLVKFIFPNDYNIYLHDTPEDQLFKEDVRAFSHGCIRLEKPEQMAQWVLGWDANRVQQAMQQGQDDRRINLPRKIPVYIAYFTTYTRNGGLYFGNDLYKRDDALIREVSAGALPSPQTLKALESLRRFVAA